MVQHRSRVSVADNSGAKELMVIQPLGGSAKRLARVGETFIGVVKGADPNGQVKDGEVVKAVLVRSRKEQRRMDGSYIKFDENAAVVIDKDGNLKGTRVFGPIAREVRDKGFNKIAENLAQGYGSARDVVYQGWDKSSGHQAVLLSAEFNVGCTSFDGNFAVLIAARH